jgi:hypothetical protein
MQYHLLEALLVVAVAGATASIALGQEFTPPADETYTIDRGFTVLAVQNRDPVACPKQTDSTAVLLTAGQSNSANYAESFYRATNGRRVVNFFDGKCYPAASPLLGATGINGESWTLLADKLIDAGVYSEVVLITTGVGGTPIARWQAGGDLNEMLLRVVNSAKSHYKITHVLWHQGERDLREETSSSDYASRFSSMVDSLRDQDVSAPVFVSVASKCGQVDSWDDRDPVTEAQKKLPDPSKGIYGGPNTNALIQPADRYDDCHFSKSGQQKFASAWLEILGGDNHR